jgi:hypothetical protein
VGLARDLLERDTAFAPARKIVALAHLSRALHHRLRVQATGDGTHCPAARREEEVASKHWNHLRERGQTTPGEERIWSDFVDMMPAGVCSGPER